MNYIGWVLSWPGSRPTDSIVINCLFLGLCITEFWTGSRTYFYISILYSGSFWLEVCFFKYVFLILARLWCNNVPIKKVSCLHFFISFARIKQKLKIELKIIQNLYRYKLRPLIKCFINVSDLHPLHVAIIYMRLHSDLVWPYLPEHCSAE